MAIAKNIIKDSISNRELSPGSGDSLLSADESDPRTPSSSSVSSSSSDDDVYNVADGENDDADSGAGSDDFDLSELGEIGAEFCLIGNWNCSVPYELYDLPDLRGILSLDTWNNCLSEDERFRLAEFLPDMDQGIYGNTLKELFAGCNFHFGSPLADLFNRLKGGLCEPRVALYRQGLNFFEKRSHYFLLRKYQNSMVRSLIQIRDAWEKCADCGIEEKLRVLDTVRSNLTYEKDAGLGSEMDSSLREEVDEVFLAKSTKMSNRALYTVRPSSAVLSQEMVITLEPSKYRKQTMKGILEAAAQKAFSKKDRLLGHLPSSVHHGSPVKSSLSASLLKPSPLQKGQTIGYDPGSARWARSPIVADFDDKQQTFEADSQRYSNVARGSSHGTMNKDRSLMQGKKQAFSKKYDAGIGLGKDTESYVRHPFPVRKENLHCYGKNRNAKQMMGMDTSNPMEKLQSSLVENGWNSAKHKDQHFFSKENRANGLVGSRSFQNRHDQQVDFFVDHPLKYVGSNVRRKKQKTGGEFQTVWNSASCHAEQTAKASPQCNRSGHAQNGGMNETDYLNRIEETESDSSEQVDGDEDINLAGYTTGALGGGQSASGRPANDHQQMSRLMCRDKKELGQLVDGFSQLSTKEGDFGEQLHIPGVEICPLKGSHSGSFTKVSYPHEYSNAYPGRKTFSSSAKSVGERKRINKSVRNGKLHNVRRGMFVNVYSAEKECKQKVNLDYSMPLSDNVDKYSHGVLEDDLHLMPYVNKQSWTKTGKKDKKTKAYQIDADGNERSRMPLLGCGSITRKQVKVDLTHLDGSDKSDHLHLVSLQPIDDSNSKKKHRKKKLDTENRSLTVVASDSIISERGKADREAERKLPKKPFTLITPSVHTGFSFSIIHLLSAVRRAMTSHTDDNAQVERVFKNIERPVFPAHENLDVNYAEGTGRKNLPSLTVKEIVDRVKSNPGDPCILETQEPLQDLVRGALKIFSSKTAPLGAKAWNPLVWYEKSTKNWSWIGPVSSISLDYDLVVEETSSCAWGVPHKMLVKLVNGFANWLKSGQETLQQIGTLPAPPPMLPNIDEKERFKDLRAQKSLATIRPSSDEMRAYFRREEVLRYSIPDRAFSYTATDGRKSIVAPLRRSGGKAREHFMLKPDRPPHVTILCLVRDAAARLPGSIGTRADVCTLIRDSQYIVENISEIQLSQVISGALDRLHYERDPCVQFDSDRKLWVYLHRDREEEDFEDDGTSSTKKWKRPRKGNAGNSGPEAINDEDCQGTGDQVPGGPAVECDSRCNLNVESASIHSQEKAELADQVLKANAEENIGLFIDTAQSSIGQGHPMGWEAIDLNSMRDTKIMCQKNSRNEDFDDEHSAGKGQLGVRVQSSMQRMDVT